MNGVRGIDVDDGSRSKTLSRSGLDGQHVALCIADFDERIFAVSRAAKNGSTNIAFNLRMLARVICSYCIRYFGHQLAIGRFGSRPFKGLQQVESKRPVCLI